MLDYVDRKNDDRKETVAGTIPASIPKAPVQKDPVDLEVYEESP